MGTITRRFDPDGPIAVISDVHGNRWALEAVLEDIERRAIRRILNLGDSLYGPLDPRGTAELLRGRTAVNVRGNQDRVLIAPPAHEARTPTLNFVLDQLRPEDFVWLMSHEKAPVEMGDLVLCHGTLGQDDRYLIEEISEEGVGVKSAVALAIELAAAHGHIVFCGHSHVPRLVLLPSRGYVVNPGSVGLPAFTDDQPFPHAMEAGSAHARYAWAEPTDSGWRIEHAMVSYDWVSAAAAAEERGRPDWSRWLVSGRAA
jgi:predicted phosphodiesterase